MLTMREMIDIMLIDDRLDSDHDDAKRLQLLDLLKRIVDLQHRLRCELSKSAGSIGIETIDETSTGTGVPPQVTSERVKRDVKRRDQLNQLTKKQAAVRASMGT